MSVGDLPRINLYRRIVQAKLYIDRFFSESIDVDDIADEACYSKFHFIRTFNDIYGRTPHQYLIHVRLENAKRLLSEGSSVTYACMAVGFDSAGSFTALFKRRNGITPSEFRRLRLARKQHMLDRPLSFIPGCMIEHAKVAE
jgi:AraC-like DNA-binding protein